jgi:2-oxoisovalerate dehydrogenase E1 component
MSANNEYRDYSKLDFLRLMLLSREGDRREGILLRQSKGWFQVSGMGHEALGCLAYLLRDEDYIFPYYRDRALMLAKGITNYELALAYFAKAGSSSGGRQMPGHYSSRDKNVFSVCTPTGGGLLPACGTAWGMKLKGEQAVCLASIGDAATRQGEYFEAVLFAFQENLPVVFLIEDNKYGISTPTERFFPYHLDVFREESFVKIDGRRVSTVIDAGTVAIDRARTGQGPTVLWADIDRLSSHTSSDDHRVYRKLEDIEAMTHRDPIRLLAEELLESGELSPEEWVSLQDEVVQIVDRDYLQAEKESEPVASTVLLHTFGTEPEAEAPPISPGRMTMVSAINQTFRKALETLPQVIFFGEDIEDPKGGVFGLTKGLSESFPNRVFNSPLAEATIMGAAVGLASHGFLPVFELQFVDFMAPGWNQITTNMSTLRWRTNGNWSCPCVIYAPYGAYLPGGSLWHSQANEAYLAHTPGIKVAIPSTPEDAAGLLWTAIHGDDPHFILIPKHIFRKQIQVENVLAVPFGQLRVVQAGKDVTVVTWGNCVELVQEAQTKSKHEFEIIDLRSIVPCDYEGIARSVEKTGRLVVVHEDNRTGGFGQTVISEILSHADWFNYFLAPPQLVAREDVHIGYHPTFEYAALPDIEQVIQAVDIVMA